MKYNLVRKHSEDHHCSIVETVDTYREALKLLKEYVADLDKYHTVHDIYKLAGITSLHFHSGTIDYHIAFWIENEFETASREQLHPDVSDAFAILNL